MPGPKCVVGGAKSEESACSDCRMHYRPLLLRACTDPGYYVLSLREEGLVSFRRARYCVGDVFALEEFVLHRFWAGVPAELRKGLVHAPALEVRHEDIVWMAQL